MMTPLLTVLLLLLDTGGGQGQGRGQAGPQPTRARGRGYTECQRGQCSHRTDREVGWEFDQPEPVFLGPELRRELEAVHRVNIRFRAVSLARPEPASTSSLALPRLLHLTWLGSPLPGDRFSGNIASYAVLNPDHEVWLWLDTAADSVTSALPNVVVRDVAGESWSTQDLLDQATNFAMKSDVLRLEILYKYGGIYADIDSVALRSFGPVFSESFLTYIRTPKNSTKAVKGAGFHTHIFGFPRHSAFLEYVLAALRQNFPATRLTLAKTGPFFLKEAFLQYPFCDQIPLIRHEWLPVQGEPGPHAVVHDDPGDIMWSDAASRWTRVLPGDENWARLQQAGSVE